MNLLPIFISILSGTIISFGSLLPKKGINQIDQRDKHFSQVVKNKTWRAGLLLLIVGWVLFLFSAKYTPISVAQTVQSTGLIVLILGAVIFLKERLTPFEWTGIILSLIGTVLLSLNLSEYSQSIVPRMRLFVSLGLVTICPLIGLWLIRKLFTQQSAVVGIVFGIFAGLLFGVGGLYIKMCFILSDLGYPLGVSLFFLISALLIQIIGLYSTITALL